MSIFQDLSLFRGTINSSNESRFDRPHRFDGTNFTRWPKKMLFLLTAIKLNYILSDELEPIAEDDANDTEE